MGLFKKLKKAAKGVFKGVKKVFKKVGKFVGKIAGSKWGKALMLSAAVFTGGVALTAGFSAMGSQAAGATFMTKFAAGAKAFGSALMNPIAATQQMATGAAGGTAGAFGGVTGAAAPGTMTAAAPAAANVAAQAVGAAPAATSTGGLLSKAGSLAGSILKTPGVVDAGGKIISSMIGGAAEGKLQEAKLKEEERIRRYYDKAWQDPSGLSQVQAASGQAPNVQAGGLLANAQNSAIPPGRGGGRQYEAGDPDQVYGGYVRGY